MKVTICLFTRFPAPGSTKTRLIPTLGAHGAADLHQRMTRQTVARADAFCRTLPGSDLVIFHEGGEKGTMRDWLGPLPFQRQVKGDLGTRLAAAVELSFSKGAERIILIGSDCPELRETHLREALSALDASELVLGPAEDGGYYLMGLRRPLPLLFKGIPWGTETVLKVTLEKATTSGLSVSLLDRLSDVDEAADLPAAERALAAGTSLTVIIPTLNEVEALETLLPLLQAGRPDQILIAHAGTADLSALLTTWPGLEIVSTPPGRGRQMNLATARATGEFLLFLHADTHPPFDYRDQITTTLHRPGVSCGAFRFALREDFCGKKLIEIFTRWRGNLFSLPYGDQGLFVRRSVFTAVGGFPEWPILEDVALVKRLRRVGKVVIVAGEGPTSARRWLRDGVIATWARHQLILVGFALGFSPDRLAKLR